MSAMRVVFPEHDAVEPPAGPLLRRIDPTARIAGEDAGDAAPVAARVVRYQRGSHLYATDGLVGTLRQVVIDEDQAEVRALVVRLAEKNETVLMPPDLVARSEDAALILSVTKEQFRQGASRSPRMEARMFTGASLEQAARAIPAAFRGDRLRSVVRLGRDCVETSDRLGFPVEPTAEAGRRPWRTLFRRNRPGVDRLAPSDDGGREP